jgi:preprotein translocase subunit Sec61beta
LDGVTAPRREVINPYIGKPAIELLKSMAKNKKNEGFHSAAGLIRYFDSEDDKALKVNPWIVVGLCIATSAIVIILGALYPT